MPRTARTVMPYIPHHVIQRGNRRQICFFSQSDYEIYMRLMSASCEEFGVEIWSYCLMPNHVHLIAVPATSDGLRLAIGRAHERYTKMINLRKDWRGYLWQGRFFSCPMSPRYTLAAAKYIELNPVRAGLCKLPSEYRWSSATAHCIGKDDTLVKVNPLLSMVGNWRDFLEEPSIQDEVEKIRLNSRTGKALGI